jgi:hypothetical protein
MPSFLCGTLRATQIVFVAPFSHICLRLPVDRQAKRAQYVGGLAGGVHPFPFRTRQLSLLAAMVLVKGRVASRQHTARVFAFTRCLVKGNASSRPPEGTG